MSADLTRWEQGKKAFPSSQKKTSQVCSYMEKLCLLRYNIFAKGCLSF